MKKRRNYGRHTGLLP